ncbi:MAG: hypothetical protein R3B36_12820 [Polyangiaceae bacterium]
MSNRLRCALAVFALASVAACAAPSEDATNETEDDLTSLTARSRRLWFQGKVFVAPGSSDAQILSAVRAQAQTAFGAMRTDDIAVNSRELKEIDTATFRKRDVQVVDTSREGDPGTPMLEVKYTYKDDAVVGMRHATRTSVPLAVMSPGYRSQTERILRECTPNDSHSRDFASTAWYIFEPSLRQCQEAIKKEQDAITQDRAKLTDRRAQVTKSEVDRLYLPITARLGADKTNRGASYPDYHRLYKGGVKENKLVVSLVYGLIDHDHGGPADDYNFGELMTTLDKVMAARGEFKVVDAPVDLGRFELPSGRVLEGVSFADAVRWKTSWSTPPGMSSADKTAAIKLFAEKIYRKWITVERTVNVKIGDEAPKDVGVQLMFYYGADRDSAPHKFATKNSDVILYNGHSYIGSGPLDPTRFTRDDFSKAYQILWVDGCVSYNYYHKDYIPLKEGGTKNLDLITNGLEAPSYRSGLAMGQFLARFLDGQGASYKDLLEAADDTDALRVVDGELDNEWRPERFPLVVR